MTARIAPLSPPYTPELQTALDKWMLPGSAAEPLKIFRTIARHKLLSERMRPLGGALLGRSSLPPRTRELLILRTCARCGAEYEWGVHVVAFAAEVGLDERAVSATTRNPESGATCDALDALVLRFADERHDSGTVSDSTWAALASRFDETALLEMLAVVGFYHLISYIVNGARIEREPWAATFPVVGARSC
jgi:4-carboxymuconolactone decarboxylase